MDAAEEDDGLFFSVPVVSTLQSSSSTQRHSTPAPGVEGSWKSAGGGQGWRLSSVQAARSYGKRLEVQPMPSHLLWFSYIANVNLTPGDADFDDVCRVEEDAVLGGSGGGVFFSSPSGGSAGGAFGTVESIERPVSSAVICRSVAERQRIVRETFAGRECQDRRRVPRNSTIRRGVMRLAGYTASTNHAGVTRRMRMNSAVSAGRVVAAVAEVGVERIFSSVRHGEKNNSMRALSVFRVCRISSSVVVVGPSRYRRRNIPAMIRITARRLPAHCSARSPYNPIAQNAATRRNDSQGSFVVQVSRPISQFSVSSHEYDLLSACVTLGGVATSSGDF